MNKILLIDFDSTFITVESLDVLADIVLQNRSDKENMLAEIKRITTEGMEGKITFPVSLEKRLRLFSPKERHVDHLIAVLKKNISPSFLRNKKFIQENREDIFVLSGGFVNYMVPILTEFGVLQSHILANQLLFDTQGNFVGYNKDNPLSQEQGKVKMVKKMNFTKPLIVIGDGYTDFEIKEAGLAEKFIVFTENISRENVVDQADIIARNFEEVIQAL